MNPNTFPTKGNLILAKNSLALASQGYELMDKKRNILIRELMALIDQAKDIQSEIDVTFQTAYRALQKANIELGISYVQEAGESIPVEDSIEIKARSIMGTEIPLVRFHKKQEDSAYRLASSIKKTQKRANALKNITIPSYSGLVRDITNSLEEKDREEFTRLKVIKRRRN